MRSQYACFGVICGDSILKVDADSEFLDSSPFLAILSLSDNSGNATF